MGFLHENLGSHQHTHKTKKHKHQNKGHFSVTGRFERLKEVAMEYAFVLKALGLMRVEPTPGSKAEAAPAAVADAKGEL